MEKKKCPIMLLFLAICLFMSLFFLYDINSRALEKENKTVKIGWYEVNNFQEGMSDRDIKSGYSYSYLQKISDYTGWEYEYVYGTWMELIELLKEGKIDALAGLSYSNERKADMLFPDFGMGTDVYCIYQHEDNLTMSLTDISSFNGKKIGSIQNSRMDMYLTKWATNNGAKIEIVYYPSIADMDKAFSENRIDGVVQMDNTIRNDLGYSFLKKLGSETYYLAIANGREDLLTELNAALYSLDEMEPSFLHNLQYSCYGITLSNRGLTSEEQKWLDNHRTLTMGYMENYLPYCATDKDGKVTGLITDVMNAITDSLKIKNRLSVNYVAYENYEDMIAALRNGNIDAAFPVGGGDWYMERDGINATTEVVSAGMDLVFKGAYSSGIGKKIAVNRNNKLQYYYSRTNFPDAEIILYDDIDECLNAVYKEEADSTILNGYRTNLLRNNSKYSSLSAVSLPLTDARSIGVGTDNSGLLFLLNRGITFIGSDYGVGAGYKYINDFYKTSWVDFGRDHIVGLMTIAVSVFGIVLLLLLLYVNGVKKAQKIKEAQIKEITGLNNELERQMHIIQSMSKVYFASFNVNLTDNTFEELNNISAVRAQIGVRGNAQESLYIFCNQMVKDDSTDRLREFVNLSTVDERLKNKPFVTCDYIGKHSGWSQLYLIAGDRDSDGKLRHVFVTSRQIHEEKAREEEQNKNLADALAVAQNANRAKTIFLSNISHDIRTPMNAIIGFTHLAETHIDDTKLVRDYIKKISISSQHMLSLINGVLDMSRIESGKMKLDEAEVDIFDIIDEVKTIIQPSLSAKKIHFSVDESEVVHNNILADKVRLNQIFVNILSNAAKFTDTNGEIRFCIAEKAYDNGIVSMEFIFRDNGIGMSEEFREHIFEAFTRERTSTVSGIQGTGLGMAITKNIIDMMGGTIAVNSEVGKGSEFIVDLQFEVVSEENSTVDNKEDNDSIYSHAVSGKHILLVEDNEINQEIAKTILEEAGYEVSVASDGDEAVSFMEDAADDDIDIILMDIQMPKMNGYEASKLIRSMENERKKNVPIYAMTANAFAEDREKAYAAGMNGHLAKPIDVKELLKTVYEAL